MNLQLLKFYTKFFAKIYNGSSPAGSRLDR